MLIMFYQEELPAQPTKRELYKTYLEHWNVSQAARYVERGIEVFVSRRTPSPLCGELFHPAKASILGY